MAATNRNGGPRSRTGVIAALIFLLGIPLSILSASVLGDGASAVIHAVLGIAFLTLAFAIADFDLPGGFIAFVSAAMILFAAIFLLQGVADITQSPTIGRLAYGVLGQWLERLLGYVFLAWCLAVLARDSWGATKFLGTVALAIALGVDLFTLAERLLGNSAAEWLKLVFLLLFVWILAESLKPPRPLSTRLGRVSPSRA